MTFFRRLELELTEVFGREVDLRTPKGLRRAFRDRVLKETEGLHVWLVQVEVRAPVRRALFGHVQWMQ